MTEPAPVGAGAAACVAAAVIEIACGSVAPGAGHSANSAHRVAPQQPHQRRLLGTPPSGDGSVRCARSSLQLPWQMAMTSLLPNGFT